MILVLAVGGVAWFLRRRPPERAAARRVPGAAPARPRRLPAPRRPWLVALFSSTVCDSCRGLPPKLARARVGRRRRPARSTPSARGDLHRRYEIAAIPTTVVADADGVVRRAFVGAFTATDLWAAVAELRDPGSTPEPDLGRELA